MEQVVNKELLENYKKALSQKYSAVCLDIDGTITMDKSKRIDKRAIKYIADLLKRNVPIVFITGRGETGLQDLLDDILDSLINDYRVTKNELKKIYILLNDGMRMISTKRNSNLLLQQKQYLVSNHEIGMLNYFNNYIVNMINNSKLKDKIKITYSYDSDTNIILNIRLNCLTKDEKIIDYVYDVITEAIEKSGEKLTVTKGVYKGDTIIQIGITKKEEAIEKAEKIIGIPKDSMLRIGDCGNIDGNDYTMLNCPQGFSVKYTSNKNDVCFPVIDENNNILKGTDATYYLLEKARIIPTICLESIDREKYKKEYAKMEKQINYGSSKLINNYNRIFNSALYLRNGMNEIFDPQSGSVIIPMYEWVLIDDNNPLKVFFNQKNAKGYNINLLKDNKNILLRGTDSYYYLLANRKSVYNNETHSYDDYTSLDNILNWLNNSYIYFKKAIGAVEGTVDLTDIMNKKMILGLLDNMRNVLLLLINSYLVKDYDSDKCAIVNLESLPENRPIKTLYSLLLDTQRMMADISTEPSYRIERNKLRDLLYSMTSLLKYEENQYREKKEEKDYSKIFRAYREIDNFGENFLSVVYVHDKNYKEPLMGICGLSYGGIELPILYKALFDESEDVVLLRYSTSKNSYKNAHSEKIKNLGIKREDAIIEGFNNNIDYIMADDNLLTAKTIQQAINIFYDLDANVKRVLVVRYPSINRFDQMMMENHGVVDYGEFFDFIQGLLFASPYTYKDNKGENNYLDSLGVFDTNRQKILECIYKNHTYAKNTEVSVLGKYKEEKEPVLEKRKV